MPNKFGSQNMGAVGQAFNQGRAAPQQARGGQKGRRPSPVGRGLSDVLGRVQDQARQQQGAVSPISNVTPQQKPTMPTDMRAMPPVPYGGATTNPVGAPLQSATISDPARGQAQTQFRQLQAPLQKPTMPTGPSTSMPPVGGATTQPVKRFPGSVTQTPPQRRRPQGGSFGGRNQAFANQLRNRGRGRR